MLSKTLNKSREEILINLNQKIEKKIFSIFKKYLKRRSKNEPIAYILKKKEFWSKKFIVNKNTLDTKTRNRVVSRKIIVKLYKKKNNNFRYWNWFWVYNN